MMLRTEFHIGLAMPDPEEFMEKLNIADALRMTQFVLIHMIIRHHSIALYPSHYSEARNVQRAFILTKSHTF